MTREEAKALLYSVAGDLGFTDVENYTCKDGEKMREAIQALEQEPMLDKIRAEIMSKDGLEEALEVIDKYVAEIAVPEMGASKEYKVGEKIPPEEWEKGKSVTEIIDEVRERMCKKNCKYPDEWDDETQGELSESEICASCPLNRL